MSNPSAGFSNWAALALARYPILTPRLTFLGHSENVTFRVDAEGGAYLLRLHQPSTTNFEGPRQQPKAIESELHWLEALSRETDLTVQEPVRNAHGELVTLIPTEAKPQGVPCTLLRWVEGEAFPQDSLGAVERLGRVMAQLHDHASAWRDKPAWFARPAYDSAHFARITEILEQGVAAGIITVQDYAVIRETIQAALELMDELGVGREVWGLIHADLHPGNCLVSGQSLTPIDFSLCGWGHFLFDVGTSLGSLDVPLRRALLSGYRQSRALPADHLRVVEAFLLLSRMSYYAFVLPRRDQREWLARRIPQVVEALCRPFLRGESFVFEVR